MLLHGKGAKVDKNDPKLLLALEELYSIIAQYDPQNVTTWTRLDFFSICFPDIPF